MANEEWGWMSSPFGKVAVVARGELICRIIFKDSTEMMLSSLEALHPQVTESSSGLVASALKQLDEYFQGNRFHFTLLLDNSELSNFSSNVQNQLLSVPFGSTVTYGELASRAGSAGAARAVGTAMSSNPFPLLVPCHRVVNADGAPGRYSAASGAMTKLQLIKFEKKHSR